MQTQAIPEAQRPQSTGPSSFPVGYFQLHPDVSLNFQMNRFYTWVGDPGMLAEMRAVAGRISNYADFTREFVRLAEQALAAQQVLKGAFFLRAAEFFMSPNDPAKRPTRERFLQLVRDYYAVPSGQPFRIPYETGVLSAYRLTSPAPRGTLVVFGGYDSYIEEWFGALVALRDAGYNVVGFDGPGQGAALEESHLLMTHAWEKPVRAVLDYFDLADVTLLGFSLGGCLAVRAAAYEPRVRRVIADDILTDFQAVLLREVQPIQRLVLEALVAGGARSAVNWLVRRAMKRSLVAEWGVKQGMHAMGVQTPYDLFQRVRLYQTRTISSRVQQDVLLLAGAEDHYVPLPQFYEQIGTLTGCRSLTARLFTRQEHAQNHCQIGNLGLSLRVILTWLETLAPREAEGLLPRLAPGNAPSSTKDH